MEKGNYQDPSRAIARELALQECLEKGIIDEQFALQIREEDAAKLQTPKTSHPLTQALRNLDSILHEPDRYITRFLILGLAASGVTLIGSALLSGFGVLQSNDPVLYGRAYTTATAMIGGFLLTESLIMRRGWQL